MSDDPLRPIIGIEQRTGQEVFDIMADRIRLASRRDVIMRTLRGMVSSTVDLCARFVEGWPDDDIPERSRLELADAIRHLTL